jgi:hypothetical protein
VASVSAVISTFERPDSCERALRSILAQEPAPLEVLVCDDGSRDDTAERFRALEQRDPRVRYLRVEPNRGGPAAARNLGLREARGEWVAFLDDDDEWLPGKLAAQLAHTDSADVIATNAVTSDGSLYFPDAPAERRPSRLELLGENAVIQSSAMVRRQALLDSGGYPEEPWLSALEDHAAWAALSDRGARFVVLGDPLVRYTTHDVTRLSHKGVERLAAASNRLAWQRVRARPTDLAVLRIALNTSIALLRARRAAGGAGPPPPATSAPSLLDHARNVNSQNGEDGIIARVFEVIGTESRRCCEFGAWDGIHFSNTRSLLEDGWSGVQIEADAERYAKLAELYRDRDDVLTINALVDPSRGGLRALLERHGAPLELDLLSIDIDGYDYEVLEGLGLSPRVICVEVNAGHDPESREAVPAEIAANNVGQPLARFVDLAERLGYRLIAYNGNAFFLRGDVGHEAELPTVERVAAYEDFLRRLGPDERVWLYRVNLGLAPPHHRYRNRRLARRALGLGLTQASPALTRGVATRALSRSRRA